MAENVGYPLDRLGIKGNGGKNIDIRKILLKILKQRLSKWKKNS